MDKSKARRDNKNQSIQNIVNHSQGDKDLVSNLEQVQVVNSKGNSKKDNSLPKNNTRRVLSTFLLKRRFLYCQVQVIKSVQ